MGLVAARKGQMQGAATQPSAIGLPALDPRFHLIGSTACRTCHRGLYQAWVTSPHGKSAAALQGDQLAEPRCLACHTPLADVPEDNVGCEACHGPGSAYAGLDVMIDPLKRSAAGLWEPTATCAYCHAPDHPFDVERDAGAATRRIHAGRARRNP